MTKLCPHIIGYTNWPELREFVERTQPRIIKGVGPFGHDEMKVAELKRLSPNSKWLLRFYLNKQPLDKPIDRAEWLAEKVKRYFDDYDIFEDYNEIDPRDHSFDPPKPLCIDTIKRYNDFSTEFGAILGSYGKEHVTGCWSNGQPPDEAWQYLSDSVEWANYVSLHGYGWPTLSETVDPQTGERHEFALRYRHIYHDLLPYKRPLILSEMGMTAAVFGGPDLGWRSWEQPYHLGAKERKAAAEWAWLLDRINEDNFVVAATPYTTGRLRGDNWISHDFTPRLYKLVGDYIVGHPSPAWEEEPMGDEIIKALDVSAYGGWHTDDEWRAAYNAGFRLAIVQAWGGTPAGPGKNPYCERLLAGARKAGMMTAVYFHLPSDTTTQTHLFIPVVKQAAGAEYEYIRFVVVDIEGEKKLHPTDPEARLADAISHIDKPVVIYTSRYMWGEAGMGGSTITFEQYPLWDALYDEEPDLDAGWIPYGGWTQRAMKQYQGTTTAPGNISADLNIADLKRLLPDEEPEDSELIRLRAELANCKSRAQAAIEILSGEE